MPKKRSGIRRIGSGVSINGKAPTKNDIVFKFETETEAERDKRTRGQIRPNSWTQQKNDAAIKAIRELPDGARFSVERYGMGVDYEVVHYVVNRPEGRKRTIEMINSNGIRLERGKIRETPAQIMKLLGKYTVQSVTIHNNGKTYNRPMSKRAEREFMRMLRRSHEEWLKREAKKAARAAKQS